MRVKITIQGIHNLNEDDYKPEDFGFDPEVPLTDILDDIIVEELTSGSIDPGDFEDVDVTVQVVDG